MGTPSAAAGTSRLERALAGEAFHGGNVEDGRQYKAATSMGVLPRLVNEAGDN
jgi:hypothetical protein